MQQRICPHCHKPAFSSIFVGTWSCPTCGKEVSEAKEEGERSQTNFEAIEEFRKARQELLEQIFELLKIEKILNCINEFLLKIWPAKRKEES